jgi:hypothetical protein
MTKDDLGADAAAVARHTDSEWWANGYRRRVEFKAAYDRRHSDPAKNYGIHGVDMGFLLSNEMGTVQFVLYTGWQLPHVKNELMGRTYEAIGGDPHWMERPTPADIGYHSPVPRYDGQTLMTDSCPFLDGRPCYYDGSSLNAEKVFDVLLNKGSDGLWKELERRHVNIFGEGS